MTPREAYKNKTTYLTPLDSNERRMGVVDLARGSVPLENLNKINEKIVEPNELFRDTEIEPSALDIEIAEKQAIKNSDNCVMFTFNTLKKALEM